MKSSELWKFSDQYFDFTKSMYYNIEILWPRLIGLYSHFWKTLSKMVQIPKTLLAFTVSTYLSGKVQLFWEGHKKLRNLPDGLYIYLVSIQTMRKIAQIFVAFSEKLIFKIYNIFDQYKIEMTSQDRY